MITVGFMKNAGLLHCVRKDGDGRIASLRSQWRAFNSILEFPNISDAFQLKQMDIL